MVGLVDLDGDNVGKVLAGRTVGEKEDFFVGDLVGRRVGTLDDFELLASLTVKIYFLNFLVLSKDMVENIVPFDV